MESNMGDDEDSCGLLLRDIEEIGKALYVHNNPLSKAFNSFPDHRGSVSSATGILESESKAVTKDLSRREKKTSFWNWKPLKALTHIRHHRFNCCFFLQVHSVESLPSDFDNLNLCVAWKRKSDMLQTSPATAFDGMCEIEETLMHRCTIYASKTGSHSPAKYEPKLFLLQASVMEAPMLDIGKHWIDLTRLLPLTLTELVGDERSLGKWTTSFKLQGEANGAMLNVSFGFSILDGSSFEPGYFVKVPNIVKVCKLMEGDNFSDFGARSWNSPLHDLDDDFPATSKQGLGMKNLDESFATQLPVLDPSITMLYQKLDEGKTGNDIEANQYHESSELNKPVSGPLPEVDRESNGSENNDADFTIIDQGVEIVNDQLSLDRHGSQRFNSSLIEIIDVADIFEEEDLDVDGNVEKTSKLGQNEHEENQRATNEFKLEDHIGFDNANNVKNLLSADNGDLKSGSVDLDSLPSIINNHDQEVNANGESRKLLSLDDIAESIENDFLHMLSIDRGPATQISDNGLTTDIDLSLAVQGGQMNQPTLTQSMRRKRNARMLESLETKSLLHDWGLSETPFQNSSLVSSGGFGSPVYPPPEDPLKLPSLGEKIGPMIRIKDGGFLRSMNPLVFIDVKNGARLVVQISAPVVLPAAMGTTHLEVLKRLANEGVRKMSEQINELLSLDDITGKTVQEIASDAKLSSDTSNRYSCPASEDLESEYISFENLVPVAVQHIEGLLMEGLKIQSGMAEQEVPSSIRIQFSENSEFVEKNPLNRSLLLEEWIKLDSGFYDIKCEVDENISQVLAAHCANNIDLLKLNQIEDDETVKLMRNDGLLSDNIMIALKVQLRDPLCDYENVGSPMLALVLVKRAFGEPNTSSDKSCEVEVDNLRVGLAEEDFHFEQKQGLNGKRVTKFKLLEGHLAGLNILSGNEQFWGSSIHQQSGARWLVSSGMAGTHMHIVPDSNDIVKSSFAEEKPLSEDVLWSISSHTNGEAVTWSEPIALNVHVRNPDIVFANESSD